MKPVGLLFAVAGVFLAWASVSTLQAQTNGITRALDLDGKDSYVELLSTILNDLDEATVEGTEKGTILVEVRMEAPAVPQ
jgi:hypothetical protein